MTVPVQELPEGGFDELVRMASVLRKARPNGLKQLRNGINPGAASAALPIEGALDAGSEQLNAKGTRFHDRAIDPTIGQARDDR